jgi:hypothetical protein
LLCCRCGDGGVALGSSGDGGGIRGLGNGSNVDDSHNKAIDSENTSHDTGNQTLENELRAHNTDGANTNSGLSSSIGCSQVGKYETGGNTHETKEGVLVDLSELLGDLERLSCFCHKIFLVGS